MAENPPTNRSTSRLFLLPLVALAALLALEYFAPAKKTPTASAPAALQAPALNQPASQALARDAHSGSQSIATLEGSRFIARFSDLNAALLDFELKEQRYQNRDGQPHELVTTDKDSYLPLVFNVAGIELPPDARWTLETQEPTRIVYSWANDSFRLRRTWTTETEDYALRTELQIENLSSSPVDLSAILHTAHYVKHSEEKVGFIGGASQLHSEGLCHDSKELVRTTSADLIKQASQRNSAVSYAGIANVYFATVIVPEGATRGCLVSASERGGSLKKPEGTLLEASIFYAPITLGPQQTSTYSARAYLGPKQREALQAFDAQTTDVVNLGWFSWIAEGLLWLLAKIYALLGNWGLAIIALTMLVKLALYPLTEKSFRSMARMRVLKPEMDRLNELYGNDREKKGAAVMELYRTHKINPLGGCLPTLLQMPIWFALYQSLSTNIALYHAPFALWWQDLSGPDPYFVLPLLVGGLMFMQQRLTPTTMDPIQTKMMLYVMPIMFTSFMLFLPSGLCLYIATNSILGIAQQKFVNYRIEKQASHAGDGPGNSAPPVAANISATASKG